MTSATTVNITSVAVTGDCFARTKTCITISENFPMSHANGMRGGKNMSEILIMTILAFCVGFVIGLAAGKTN